MSEQSEKWSRAYDEIRDVYDTASVVIRYTYGGSLLLVTVYLCFIWLFRNRRATPRFVFLQLTLELLNLIFLFIYLHYSSGATPIGYSSGWLLILNNNLCNLLFMLSHWIFVYHYLKVALLIPFFLRGFESDRNSEAYVESGMQEKELKVGKILRWSNISFVVLCFGIFVLCSLISFEAIEIVMGFPFVIICVVLVWAMSKIKTLL